MSAFLRLGSLLAAALLFAGCATVPPASTPTLDARLWRDDAFPPRATVETDIFAVSPAMHAFLRDAVRKESRRVGKIEGLIAAMRTDGKFILEYDASYTRTASEAFAAHQGNCLSLTLMTAALARELGLTATFQEVLNEQMWTQTTGYYIASGHINVLLSTRASRKPNYDDAIPVVEATRVRQLAASSRLDRDDEQRVVDFLPGSQLRGLMTRPLTTARVTAMYYANRSAESMLAGDARLGYWYARAALDADPGYGSAYNILAVLYHKQGILDAAEAALRKAIALAPDDTKAWNNLAGLLEETGRPQEAAQALEQVRRLEADPPLLHYRLARQALQRGDYALALSEFNEERRRSGDSADIHLGLAAVYLAKNDYARAQKELKLAVETSVTVQDAHRFSSKLEWLKSKAAEARIR
ncbi:MAG: tetratricopeptide repeat protein [Rudaea sp.]|uniref:tetratricopeptide repeat protein n=1 Tax=Rudaea sp. TaxID=2136325 RepID=UPI0039E2A6E4